MKNSNFSPKPQYRKIFHFRLEQNQDFSDKMFRKRRLMRSNASRSIFKTSPDRLRVKAESVGTRKMDGGGDRRASPHFLVFASIFYVFYFCSVSLWNSGTMPFSPGRNTIRSTRPPVHLISVPICSEVGLSAFTVGSTPESSFRGMRTMRNFGSTV